SSNAVARGFDAPVQIGRGADRQRTVQPRSVSVNSPVSPDGPRPGGAQGEGRPSALVLRLHRVRGAEELRAPELTARPPGDFTRLRSFFFAPAAPPAPPPSRAG